MHLEGAVRGRARFHAQAAGRAGMSHFPFTEARPIEHGATLPPCADVVVIGGGVIGVCTALELARAGQKVVLLEKGRIAAEQSSRNWGWVRVQGRDLAEIPIMLEARRLWSDLDADCRGRTGLATVGVSYLAATEAKMAGYAAWLESAKDFGLDTRLLSRAETSAAFPGAKRAWQGAMSTPSDMKAEPWVAVPELARLAASEGVAIREGCAVRALDIAAGRIAGVITEAGRIACDAVVLAGGAWSSLLLRRHGVNIPQLSVRSSVMATGPMAQVHSGAASEPGMAWRRRSDGGYTIAWGGQAELYVGPDAFRALPKYLPVMREDPGGFRLKPLAPKGFPDGWTTPRRWAEDQPSPFEAQRILNPAPNTKGLAQAARQFEAIWPEAGPVKPVARWAGMIDVMPDIVPVVDSIAALPGLTVATGMSGHGFGIGPAFGRIAARLVRGEDPGHDLSRFRYARFSDGARMDPGPAI
ncbi:NAD(P)/FAD-dependent oxidoreductase [Mesobacterium pallidum]|uniref:NAD(P)/FAD-dependent oxidoreductase n=1 Tax=Mesobacterium pallidum TaxID=2872037 RepID=UPI001EE32FD8